MESKSPQYPDGTDALVDTRPLHWAGWIHEALPFHHIALSNETIGLNRKQRLILLSTMASIQKETLPKPPSGSTLPWHLIAGAAAGGITKTAVAPLERCARVVAALALISSLCHGLCPSSPPTPPPSYPSSLLLLIVPQSENFVPSAGALFLPIVPRRHSCYSLFLLLCCSAVLCAGHGWVCQ